MAEISKLVEGQPDPILRATLYFALSRNTDQKEWQEKFAMALKSAIARAETAWINGIFGCCGPFDESMWTATGSYTHLTLPPIYSGE